MPIGEIQCGRADKVSSGDTSDPTGCGGVSFQGLAWLVLH
jgi:hypothetical protein